MLKGIQKQMIMIKTSKSPIFETAYLVVRADLEDEPQGKEMIAEANRILEGICKNNSQRQRERSKLKRKRIALSFLGMVTGVLLFLLGFLMSGAMHS